MGLVIFGVIEIALGGLCVVLVGLIGLSQALIPQASGARTDFRMLLPVAGIYLGLAGVFVWLGIGSIKCRRWARALTLIGAWFWLCVGLVTVPLMGFVMPRVLAAAPPNGQQVPHGMLVVILVVQLVVMSLALVMLPAVFVWFYSSRHVKATCEARDPVHRWTDGCPLPVLGGACALWMGAATMLIMPVTARGTLPFFGMFVSGLTGSVLSIGIAALFLWLGRAWYRLNVSGWWVLLAALFVLGISNLLTFSHVDFIEMYQKMGYPEAQIDLIRRQGLISNQFLIWSSLMWFAPTLGYLIWVKRYFRSTPGATRLDSSATAL